MKDYKIIPIGECPRNFVEPYWAVLHEHDLLKYRLGDMAEPNLRDAESLVAMFLKSMYIIVDHGWNIVAEFTLCSFTGKSAQIHFSMHPNNSFRESINIGTRVTDSVLNSWKVANKPDEPYLTSIYGLTPLLNRPACLLVLKTGFKKLGVLPDGVSHLGVPCDGMISVKTSTNYTRSQRRENNGKWKRPIRAESTPTVGV